MSTRSPLWISLGLFCAPLLLMLLLSPLLTDWLARHLLESKGMELAEFQKERTRILDHHVPLQLDRFVFDCGPKDMALLREPEYYNRHIRLAGLQLANGTGCSTLGLAVPLLSGAAMPTDPGLHFTSTVPMFDTERETLVYGKRDNNLAFWVLDSSWSHELLRTPCDDCFYLEFNHKDPARAGLYFPRGNKHIREEANAIRVTSMDELHRVEQDLWAGKALHDYARSQVRHDGLWFGGALGLLLVAAYWGLRNYRRSLKGLLQAGLARKEFIPFYQPVVDSRTRQVVGFEALLRWQRGGGLVPPGAFIGYAEEQGLILPMTSQLLEKVIADLPKLADGQWVSVNIVATHLEHPHLRELLQQNDWPSPIRLTFELTEREPIKDIKTAMGEITTLQEKGYHIKLDDFGTGYGGFAYLQRLGIRQIKIDKMFVDTIGTDDLKRSVLDAIIAFGRKSGMEMIAEGVETQAQVDYLSEHGVYLIQGYVYAKPMSLSQLKIWQMAWSQSRAST
ncbi:EAL domain-containing protein [Aeromonas taiwanensis]|uniref:EAL domain-containing protein n=1 Tax=Aeromonas taiwanensis TaxID=633417 RepID=A0A5F0K8X5_9GAMM|nr:EAL domain-containing protein [Aeromonas taiwanensis]TFF74024.1 EAL domain-containing protein [Aeromonas taiwanensis]TFF74860.1 EAL domain-containing protein [Aeromonas taiwanensis]TFF78078.1 EAL domain-containing protein [Aeromonas taiwanensis]